MRDELGVVEVLDRLPHVLVAVVLHYPGTVTIHVRVAHIAALAHVVLQILPAARRRQSFNQHSVVGAL